MLIGKLINITTYYDRYDSSGHKIKDNTHTHTIIQYNT